MLTIPLFFFLLFWFWICFCRYRVQGTSAGINDLGYVQTHLVVALFGAWVLVFLCLIRGVNSVGKVKTFDVKGKVKPR